MRLTRRTGLRSLAALIAGGTGFGAGGTPAVADPAWPFDLPAGRSGGRSGGKAKRVFAHWHVYRISNTNQDPAVDHYARQELRPEGLSGKFADAGGFMRERPLPRPPRPETDWLTRDMEDDVRRAADIGLDGFQFNIVDYRPKTAHWQNFKTIMAAAERVPGFTILPSLDGLTLRKSDPVEAGQALAPFRDSPALARTADGRPMLGNFMAEAQTADWWKAALDAFGGDGPEVAFFPMFLDPGKIAKSDILGRAEGVGLWSANGLGNLAGLDAVAAQVRKAGKLWLAPVCPQDFRPKRKVYFEAGNSRLFRQGWAKAIAADADWAQIMTWNDYSEASEIAPSTGIQWAFYDLAAYYIAWFKNGAPPPITRDVLFYFHRVQAANANEAGARFTLRSAKVPVDEVELLAFLAEPGLLEIDLGGKTAGREAPAGITSFTVPLQPGRPRFRLRRGERTVIDLQSAFPIEATLRYPDLLYRAGSSSRAPVAMLALPNA